MPFPDPVTSAATVAGILQLTVTALQAIDKLHLFWKDASPSAIAQFTNDLKASQNLLKDVQDICKRIEDDNLQCLSKLRLQSLSLHIQSYTQDLAAWQKLSDSFQPKATGDLDLVTKTSAPFKKWTFAVRKASRKDVLEAVARHYSNIEFNLSLLQMYVIFPFPAGY